MRYNKNENFKREITFTFWFTYIVKYVNKSSDSFGKCYKNVFIVELSSTKNSSFRLKLSFEWINKQHQLYFNYFISSDEYIFIYLKCVITLIKKQGFDFVFLKIMLI